ncbi:MAG: Rieske 2Fe-2S domain-containing protein [Actinomycetota bacterium]
MLRSERLPQSDFNPPVTHEVEVAGFPLLLARRPGGDVVAFATHCPHQGTPLKSAGFVWDGYLQCSQHGYVYDPTSGENVLPTRTAPPEMIFRLKPSYLRTHRVEERDGWIWVDIVPNPRPPEYGPDNPPPHFSPPRTFGAGSRPAPLPEGPVEHSPESLTVTAGATFELTVPTRAMPGHIWRMEAMEDLVALTGQSFEPGARPVYRLQFSARAPGETTVRCLYSRPWRAMRPTELRTFRITVE